MSKELDLVEVDHETAENLFLRTYETTDFDFVAFAMAYAKPKVKIVAHKEWRDPDAVDSRKSSKFTFFLAGADNEDVTDDLEKMALAYMNKQLEIEPSSLLNSRKQLRVWMVDHQKPTNARHNRNQNAGGK